MKKGNQTLLESHGLFAGETVIDAKDTDAEPLAIPGYELLLLTEGSCELRFEDARMLLIQGDLVIVGKERPHLLCSAAKGRLLRCVFAEGEAEEELSVLFDLYAHRAAYQRSELNQRIRKLRVFEASPAEITALRAGPPAELDYIAHLGREETDCVKALLQNIIEEQEKQLFHAEQMRRVYLQQILILLTRMRLRQFETGQAPKSWKKELVDRVLQEIDQNLSKSIDFEEIARQQGITATYFRSVFKEIVGVSPVDYLNRMRILSALERLQVSDLSIAEIAESVGIYDANYFSRLFKKVTGYPPRYFKSISTDTRPDGTAR